MHMRGLVLCAATGSTVSASTRTAPAIGHAVADNHNRIAATVTLIITSASATMRIADDRGGQIGRNLKISSRPYSRD
jgi:hypothetical protein